MRRHREAEDRHVDNRFFQEPPRWLRRSVTIEIEGVGAHTNPVEEEKV
jgi:hypothetical protein